MGADLGAWSWKSYPAGRFARRPESQLVRFAAFARFLRVSTGNG